jgi:hypothetical protein
MSVLRKAAVKHKVHFYHILEDQNSVRSLGKESCMKKPLHIGRPESKSTRRKIREHLSRGTTRQSNGTAAARP